MSKQQCERDALIKEYSYVAITMAKRFDSSTVPLQDRIQAGMVGLIKAAERFDREYGSAFTAYASWWIRKEILSALKQTHWIRLPNNQYALWRTIARFSSDFRTKEKRLPSVQEISAGTGIPFKKVTLLLGVIRADRKHLRLELPGSSEVPQLSLHDILPEKRTLSPDFGVVAKEELYATAQRVQDALDLLFDKRPRHHYHSFVLRFGLHQPFAGAQFDETAELLGYANHSGALKAFQTAWPVLKSYNMFDGSEERFELELQRLQKLEDFTHTTVTFDIEPFAA